MRFRILFGAAMLVASCGAVAAGLVGITGIASAHPSRWPSGHPSRWPSGHPSRWSRAYTCAGGDLATGNFVSIPSGTYSSINVTGACNVVPGAVIRVFGNVNVAAGAVFDAQSAPSTITVGHDVTAGPGSLLGLGCLPNPPEHSTGHACTVDPTGSSDITVNGDVSAWDANTVLLNGITVKRNVTVIGGGEQTGSPWSIKTDTIGGSLTVFGATPEWLGVLVDTVGGNVILGNVTIADGETIDVVNNTIGRNLACWRLAPAVSGGVPGSVNVVGGKALGQCANLQDIPPS